MCNEELGRAVPHAIFWGKQIWRALVQHIQPPPKLKGIHFLRKRRLKEHKRLDQKNEGTKKKGEFLFHCFSLLARSFITEKDY